MLKPKEPVTQIRTIAAGDVVAFHFLLWNDGGELLDSSKKSLPLLYLHGQQMLLPALEESFVGRSVGETFAVKLTPRQAYGAHDPSLIETIDRSLIEVTEGIDVGSQLVAETTAGETQVRVVAVDKNKITVDGNHPLAGLHLKFLITVQNIRPASEAELRAGQPLI